MPVKILMFHRVLPEAEVRWPNAYFERGTLITQERFRMYLDDVAAGESDVVTLREWREMGFPEDKNLTILTFDDGYRDNYKNVLPELERRGWKGVFFPVMGCCESHEILPLDRYYQAIDEMVQSAEDRADLIMGRRKRAFLMAELHQKEEIISSISNKAKDAPGDRLYMNAEELRSLCELGHEIGGHTIWHELMTGEPNRILEVLSRNAEWLQTLTGESEFSFAWPDGRYDDNAMRVIQSTPFFCACDVRQEWFMDDRLFRVPRIFCTQL